MHIVVLVLGLMASVAGLGTVVFGLSIKEFTFGGTLLITGTTTLVGGLVMIAVAGAIRELNRIARALLSRPAPAPRFPRPGEPFDPHAPGSVRPGMPAPRAPGAPAPMPPTPAPMPARRPEAASRDARPQEARVESTAPAEPHLEPSARAEARLEAEPPFDRVGEFPEPREPATPGPQPDDQAAVETHVQLQESEGAPLSPDEMPRHAASGAPAEAPEPADATEAAQHEHADSEAFPPREDSPSAERRRLSPFDAIWPPREPPPARRFAGTDAESVAPRDEQAAHVEDRVDAPSPATAPDMASDTSWRTDDAVADHARDRDPPAEPAHAVSILKSGVVDGMAYTLYSDGSIEAELPTGTVRFASIDELRMHLEKSE